MHSSCNAQYGPMAYDGRFYWLADDRANQGFRWYEPPRRGWSESGAPWSAMTSFPERIWEFPIAGGPPNDPCYQFPFVTPPDPDFGPFGLQVNQYLAEWWEGTTYFSHPNKPAGWSAGKFGFFDFAPRGDRPAVASDGLPAGFVGQSTGQAGACAGRLLAGARGSGNPWEAGTADVPSGEPCMAWPAVYVVRMNLETRCEPDLSLPDIEGYTFRFYELWDTWGYPIELPDGASVPLLFPSDYPDGDSGALGRVWLRRADVGLKQWINNGSGPYAADVAASSVFSGAAGGGSLAAVGGVRPDYLEQHAWRLDSATADERRGSARNMLRTYDHDGNVVADYVIIRDLMTETEDCLSLEVASYETAEDIDWRCGRVNSAALASHSLQSGGSRYSDVGAASPAEVAAVLTTATVPGAVGNRQPEPPGANFWFEYDTFSIRCHAGFYSERDLPLVAEYAIEAYQEEYPLAWQDYLDLQDLWDIGLATDDAVNAAYQYVSDLRGMLEGWRVIYAYRDLVHGELLSAVRAAGYAYGGAGGGLAVDFDGVGCDAELVTLQPFRRQSGGNVDVAPPNAGGLTAEMALVSWKEVAGTDRFTAQQQAAGLPHYIGDSRLSLEVGAASHYVRDHSMRAGSEFPTGPTHWDGVDVTHSPNLFIPLACGKPQENVFAPDVTHIPSVGFWTSSGEWEQILDPNDPRRLGRVVGGGRAFDPRSFASYTECKDSAFGAGDCYASDEMRTRMSAYNPGGAETLTGRALAAHREALESGVDQGLYKADQFRDYDTSDRSPLFSVNSTVSSGDLDASGNLIEHEGVNMLGDIGEPTSYAVETLSAPHALLYGYNPTFTGLGNLDHLSNGTRHEFTFVEYYWGVAPGTAVNGPPGTIAEADMETMTRTGPVRLSSAMGYARGGGVGSCTVCSELGCDDSVVEEFVGERFTARVTEGTAVCLIGPTPLPRPRHSCPTVANTR